MFSADKPLPPPPAPPKPRNASISASMPSYRSRPSTSSSSGASASQAFDAARALFQVAKQPEVRNTAVAAAKNPVLRSAAVSAAKNEQVRSTAIKTLQDDKKRESFFDMAKAYDAQLARSKGQTVSSSKTPSLPTEPRRTITPTPTSMGQTASIPKPATTSMYPSLNDDALWGYPKETSVAPLSTSSTNSWATPQSSTPSWGTPSYSGGTGTSSTSNFSAIHNELASLNLFTSSPKKVAPARPPPPKGASRSSASPSPTNEPHAIVKYPYKSTHSDELNCLPNDVVLLKKEVDEQWIFALNTRTGERGIVPIVFLNIKVPLAPTQRNATSLSPSSSSPLRSEKYAVALYDFSSAVDGDLNFSANERIRVIEKVGEEWLRGQIGTRTGIFPSTFVQLETPTSPPAFSSSVPSTPSAFPTLTPVAKAPPQTVTAGYDFNSGVAGDLVFRSGDVIEVVERVNDEWIRGRLRGTEGLVPCTFLLDTSAPVVSARTQLSSGQSSGFGGATRIVCATRDYFNPASDHLCFSRGDQIEVVEEVDDIWLRGKLILNMPNTRSFPCGLFPRSAIQ